MTRRRWLLTTAVAVSALVLSAGCSSDGGGGDSTDGQKQDVTINVLVSSGHQQFSPLWDKLDAFKAKTGITVNIIQVATADIRATIMQDLRLGENAYDILEIPDDTLAAASEFVTPLNDLIAAEPGGVDAWKAADVAWAVKAAQWDGKILYEPIYTGGEAMMYRDQLLSDPTEQAAFKAKYGYDLPVPPSTREQLIDVAEFFTRPPGMYGLVFPGTGETSQNVMENLIFQAGYPYLDDKNNSLWRPGQDKAISDVAAEAQFMQDLIFKYKVVPPTVTAMSTSESSATYVDGKAAMIYDLIHLNWGKLQSADAVQRLGESKSFLFPAAGKDHGGIPFYWMLGVNKSSQHADAAWQFINWWIEPDNLKATLTGTKGVYTPPNIEAAKWAVDQGILPPATVKGIQEAQVYPLNDSIAEVRGILRKYTEELMLNKISGQQFAEQSGVEIQEFMESRDLVKK